MTNISKEILMFAVAFSKPIDELELSTRTWNALHRWGVYTIADLVELGLKGELSKIRNLGEKSLNEIDYMLDRYIEKWTEVQ